MPNPAVSTPTRDIPNRHEGLCLSLHLALTFFKAGALMWAHAMGLKQSIFLAYNKLHLVLGMLLSSALWLPVIALPTYFITLRTHLWGAQACELVRCASQYCRRKRKSARLPLLVCRQKKLETYFAKV